MVGLPLEPRTPGSMDGTPVIFHNVKELRTHQEQPYAGMQHTDILPSAKTSNPIK